MTCLLAGMVRTAAAQSSAQPDDAAIALARRTVAREKSIAEDRLHPVTVTAVEWRDSSLGCPQRGFVYTPMLTPGFRVILLAEGMRYDVRVSGGRAVVCEPPPDTKVSPTPLVQAASKAGDAVRRVLAKQLEIPADQIRVTRARPIRSVEKGCPKAPARAQGNAYVVEATAGGKVYRYYSDAVTTVSCEEEPAPKVWPVRQQGL